MYSFVVYMACGGIIFIEKISNFRIFFSFLMIFNLLMTFMLLLLHKP